MFNLDPAKLLVIAIVAIILLGPDKLPQVAKQAGAAWRTFNEFRHRMESEVRNTMPDLPPTSEIARLARSPSALLTHLSNMAPDEEASADGQTNGDGTAASDGSVPEAEGAAAGAPAAPAAADSGSGAAPTNGTTSSGAVDGAAEPVAPAQSGDQDASSAATPLASTVPTPAAPAPSSPAPEVIAPGDPTLN